MSNYSDFYKTAFGRKVLEEEAKIVLGYLGNCKRILSVGCGPAFLESRLGQLSEAEVVGLEQNRKMIEQAEGRIEAREGSAEKMQFADKSFDCVLFVTSLLFISDYKKAVAEAARVLSAKGKILALVLNPQSNYFREHRGKQNSYFRKIKHKNLRKIKKEAEKFFSVEGSYCLGIEGEKVFNSHDKKIAALYVLKGIKK